MAEPCPRTVSVVRRECRDRAFGHATGSDPRRTLETIGVIILALSVMLMLFGQGATPSFGTERTVSVSHLTSGGLAKSGVTTQVSAAPITIPPDSLGLVHLLGCCDHAAVPSVVGAALRWDLLVTHTTGEKRHWVFRATTGATPASGALTVRFATAQSRVLWIVDSVTGTPTGNNGADAIVQTRWQNSQANASSGSIALAPLLSGQRGRRVRARRIGTGDEHPTGDRIRGDGRGRDDELESHHRHVLGGGRRVRLGDVPRRSEPAAG